MSNKKIEKVFSALKKYKDIRVGFADVDLWADTGVFALNRKLSNTYQKGFLYGRTVGVYGEPGSGKACHPDTPVLCEDGWKPIKDIRVGQRVWTPAGTLASVIATQYNDPAHLYRVQFADGREIVTNAEHLWKTHHKHLYRENQGECGEDGLLWCTTTTEQIADRLQKNNALRWYIPLAAPVPLDSIELPIPPYLMGVILGDGHLSVGGTPNVTNPDREIFEEAKKEGELYGFAFHELQPNTSGCARWSICNCSHAIDNLGLRHKLSHEKYVPPQYKKGSIEQRRAILQGLMDTDGDVGKNGNATFSSTSFQLACDVQELVWSLGGIAKVSSRQTFFTYNGIRKPGKKSWRVNIRLQNTNEIFRVARKHGRGRRNQYSNRLKLRIKSISREPTQEASICITLDSGDGLYIVDNFIVTHNSLLLAQTAANEQKQRDALIVWIDVEGAVSDLKEGTKWFQQAGLDTDPERFQRLHISTFRMALKTMSEFVNSWREDEETKELPPLMIVFDSYSNLQTDTMIEQNKGKKELTQDMGQKARQLGDFLIRATGMIEGLRILVTGVMHVYMSQEEYGPRHKMTGGVKALFTASQSIMLTKYDLTNEKASPHNRISVDKDDAKENIGIRSVVNVLKCRYAKPFEKVDLEIIYPLGIDPYSGLFDLFIGDGTIVSPSQGWYEFKRPDGTAQKFRRSEFLKYADELMSYPIPQQASNREDTPQDIFEETPEAEVV